MSFVIILLCNNSIAFTSYFIRKSHLAEAVTDGRVLQNAFLSWYVSLWGFFLTAKVVSDKTCSLPVEEAGIIWDSICFLCLLLQRRVFLSFYFLHVVAELQASAKQASR